MTVTERLQGAGLCFLFAVVCIVFGRSMIQEPWAGAKAPRSSSVAEAPKTKDRPMVDVTPERPIGWITVGDGTSLTDTAIPERP